MCTIVVIRASKTILLGLISYVPMKTAKSSATWPSELRMSSQLMLRLNINLEEELLKPMHCSVLLMKRKQRQRASKGAIIKKNSRLKILKESISLSTSLRNTT